MNRTSNIVHAYQYYQILRFGVTLLFSIILVKSSLPLKEIALFEFLLFLSNFLSFFWANGLKNGMLVQMPTQTKEDQGSLFFSIYLLLFGIGILIGGCFYVSHEFVLSNLVQYDTPYIHWMIIFMILNTPCVLIESYYLIHRKAKPLFVYGSLIFLIKFLLLVFVLFQYTSLESLMMTLIGWACIKCIWLIWILIRNHNYLIKWSIIRSFLLLSIPLIGHALMGNGVDYIDGFLISSHYSEETFAIYRYGARELPFVLLIIGAFTTSLIPKAVQDLDGTLIEIKRTISSYMNWMFPLTILIVLISPILFPLIYDMNFKDSAYILNIYALILISRLLLPQIIFYGKKQTKTLFLFSLCELVLNVALSLILMRYLSYYGIALGSVIAFAISKISMIQYCKIVHGYGVERYLDIKRFLGYSLILIFAFFISYQY